MKQLTARRITEHKTAYVFDALYEDGRIETHRAISEKKAKILRTSIKYKRPSFITPVRKETQKVDLPLGLVAVVSRDGG
jgi:hypothetical protein